MPHELACFSAKNALATCWEIIHTNSTLPRPRSISVRFETTFTCALLFNVNQLSETEFARICDGIHADRESIIPHNPIGTPEETLLWMLLSVLLSYLSVEGSETPCFTGTPNAETYHTAISFVLKDRRDGNFDAGPHIERMLER